MPSAALPCREAHPNDVDRLWFAEPGTPEEREAAALCFSCPIREQCAQQGMTEEYGVWGGLSPANTDRRQRLRVEFMARREAMRAQAITLTADGFSRAEVARELGTAITNVQRLLGKCA